MNSNSKETYVAMLNICVIGGASTYTPELIEGFIEGEGDLPIKRVTLMDINPQRLINRVL